MSKLVDLYHSINPETGQIITGGTHRQDPEPVGWEHPYAPSLDLAKDQAALDNGRYGNLGSGAGGYNPSNPYSDIF